MHLSEKLKKTIRDVQDYPKAGILFKDITPVLADTQLTTEIVAELTEKYKSEKLDAIAGVEARGFIFGSMLAYALKCRFIPVRKAGRLPFKKITQAYDLEYGNASIEMHVDAIEDGWLVLVHDDLLATGGTASATADLINQLGGKVAGFSFLINLGFMPGAQNLEERFGVKPHYLVKF